MSRIKPKAMVTVGYGINCDYEMQAAFQLAGARAYRIHLNELIKDPKIIREYHIIGFPGGFSFADDTFAGNIFAELIKSSVGGRLKDEITRHIESSRLVLGVCNGNQIGTMANLIPVFKGFFDKPEVGYTNNDSARYENRGNIHLRVISNLSCWLKGLYVLRNIPIGHGEGKFYTDKRTLEKLYEKRFVAFRYAYDDGTPANGVYPINPNGSLDDIAGLASETVLLMMPHPERAIRSYNQDGWTIMKSMCKRTGQDFSEEGDGIKIIRNGVEAAKKLV